MRYQGDGVAGAGSSGAVGPSPTEIAKSLTEQAISRLRAHKLLNKRIRSLRIDRTFPGVGRISRASGTSKKATFQQVNAMITTLAQNGRVDLLVALRDAKIAPLVLWDAYRRGRLDEVADPSALKPLIESFKAWREAGNKRKGEPWSRHYAQNLKHTEKRFAEYSRPGASISDLPELLMKLRDDYVDRRRTFDQHRIGAMSFARATCGRGSLVYRSILDVEPYSPKRTKKTHPLTVAQLLEWSAKLDPQTASCCWAMATTGMGPGEYWSWPGGPTPPWERFLDRIEIHGTKREARERAVPDLGRCETYPVISQQAFEDRLKKQTAGAFQPYDLRRTFANWLEDARIPRARVKLYMGHALGDVTDLYTTHDVTQFLRDDARILRAWMESKSISDPRSDTRVISENG